MAGDSAECACLSYPRVLRDVLDADARAYLTRLYFETVHAGKSASTYYNWLHQLAVDRADDAGWRALATIEARIRREFGEGFEVMTDFFSYRAHGVRLFPTWHQDGEFWLADDGGGGRESCASFNLWLLLAHEGMAFSFDVLDTAANRWLYDDLYARRYALTASAALNAPRSLFSPEEWGRLARGAGAAGGGGGRGGGRSGSRRFGGGGGGGGGGGTEPSSGLGGLLRPNETRRPAVANVPLAAGDGLVLKQVEIHRTDSTPLRPDQWRLALGLKVLRRQPLVREPNAASPWGYDSAALRLRWQGLLPDFQKGRPLPRVYNRTALRALDAAARRPAWAAFLLSGTGMTVLAPLAFLALMAAAALCAAARPEARARTARRGAGGRRLDDVLPTAARDRRD
jgi:uncharacterized membrane protein YgcG